MKIQSLRGMRDVYGDEAHALKHIEEVILELTKQYAPVNLPLLEPTELFERTIGSETDIVSKEMYTFLDKKDKSMTLRPEGTAGCVRMAIETGQIHNQVRKYWYFGPMLRYERPQKGRYRQFLQLGMEFFGLEHYTAELEIIIWVNKFLKSIKLPYTLKLNTIGTKEEREKYTKALVEFFADKDLDEANLKKLNQNPLRILDSKDEHIQAILKDAPLLEDFLERKSKDKFKKIKQTLRKLRIAFEVDPMLVRGLDYYNDTVFEWVAEGLGAQNAIGGGGRYDGLVGQLGGKETAAVGFALGIDRIIDALVNYPKRPEVNLIIADITRYDDALRLYKENPKIYHLFLNKKTLEKQFKYASQIKADNIYYFSNDIPSGKVKFKPMGNSQWRVRELY